jgi:hypothetical protein
MTNAAHTPGPGRVESETRTVYNVHIYREMRLFYPDIVATSHEDAATQAAAKGSDDADLVDDCDGETFAALVDIKGDLDYCESKTIDFPATLLRNHAPELLEAAERVVSRWEKGDLAEAVRELNAAIATAKGHAP